ncbi:MAG: DUF6470 family protein [Hungatella sp.]
MEQLLSIQSIPMKFELSVTPARMEYTAKRSEIMQKRIPGGLEIQNDPAKLFINTRSARDSVSPTLASSIRNFAQKGKQSGLDATAQFAMEGRQLLDAKPGDDVLGQIIAQRNAAPIGDFQLGFIPHVGPEIQYQEPNFQMRYQADKLQFDVRVANGNVHYTPGDVSMNITQWPDVVIKYMGRPMYVPPSAVDRFEASA